MAAVPDQELVEYLQKCHSLTVSVVPEKGRCLIANRVFHRGEVILEQEPYVCALDDSNQAFRCDLCYRQSSNLKRCSACKTVLYCCTNCQRSGWGLHKFECTILVRLLKEKKRIPTPTLRLVLRLLIKRRLQAERALLKTAVDNYDVCEALPTHMSETSEDRLVMYAQMASVVHQMMAPDEVNVKEVTQMICRFACNAHTICDEEVRPLGTGLYPVISIVNHSCLPNAVLHFDGNCAALRALEDIQEGTEISISYVELAASTHTRRKVLRDQYYFDCNCIRCCRSVTHEGSREDSFLEGYSCVNPDCDGPLIEDPGSDKVICEVCGLKRGVQQAKSTAKKIESDLLEASNLYAAGKLEIARRLYSEVEAKQRKLWHRYSVPLLRTHDALLKICMDMKDWASALEFCRSTIPGYERAYPPFSPLLGLQYFTLGKLLWLLGDSAKAVDTLRKAYTVIQVTHGSKSELLHGLASSLQEAQAEVAYNRSMTNRTH